MPLLFSYGTLQQAEVQRSTFGRELAGTPDVLVGYVQSLMAIEDPEVVRTSGKTHHPVVRHTGNADSTVSGTVFEITLQELQNLDRRQVAAFGRVTVKLLSGRTAWVYVDARNGKDRPKRLPRNWVI